MNREGVLNSDELKTMFCKDWGIPISILANPYFYERLETLDVQFDCVDKFDIFCWELEQHESVDSYKKYRSMWLNKIVEDIHDSVDYLHDFLDDYDGMHIQAFYCRDRELYIKDNDGKAFISIAIKEPDFQVLRQVAPGSVRYSDTWSEYAGMFVSDGHLKNCTGFMDDVLRTCNKIRKRQFMDELIQGIAFDLTDAFSSLKVYSIDHNEILIDVLDDTDVSLSEIRNFCPKWVDISAFVLNEFNGGWVRDYYSNDDLLFVGFSDDVYHLAIKTWFGEKIISDDLVFEYKDTLAKYLKSPF